MTAGRQLGERHAHDEVADDDPSLLNYAESPRAGDWTLRSALVRLAQPEPVRAGAVLELVRRLDAALQSVRDAARAVEIARLAAEPSKLAAVVQGYESVCALSDEERAVLPLLLVAVELDQLAGVLAEWANGRKTGPPVDVIDATVKAVFARLEELGVPQEQEPPNRRGRGV